MFPNPRRLYRRVISLIVAASLLTLGYSAIASAESPRLPGKTTVVGAIEPRGTVVLSTDFGTIKKSGSYLFNTEVRNLKGTKVAQFTDTTYVRRGDRVSRTYNWNTANVPNGKYTFSIGISKPRWTGLIGWSDTAGSIVLGANNWDSSAIADYSVTGTDPISLDGRFVSPENAQGTYTLAMTVLSGTQQVATWTQVATVTGAQTFHINKDFARPGPGTYTVALKVTTGDAVVYNNLGAGVFALTDRTGTQTPVTMAPSPAPVPPTSEAPVTTSTTAKPATTTTAAKPTTSTPAPTSSGTSSNGLGDLPGWKLQFNENFNTDAAEGSFLAKYTNFSAYPYPWKDTSGNGTYQPNIISVSNGNMVMNLRTNSAGEHLVAAPEPKTNNGKTDQLYGRYSVRFKADSLPNYKTAWLLWPQSDVWSDGEIDFPEGNLDGKIEAFSHYVGNPSAQDAFSTGVTFSSWHVATTEWSPGKVSFYMDDKLIGTTTKNVPNKPMHWVLQTETGLDGRAPANSTTGNVYVDWAAAWAYTG